MEDITLDKFGKRAPIAELSLNAEQRKRLDTVIAWSIFHQPFFAHMMMAQLPIVPTTEVPIAATDSFSIFINPEAFFAYTIPEQAFILFHEVMHCVFGDCLLAGKWKDSGKVLVDGKGTYVKYDSDVMNQAMDYVINAMLIEGKCGAYRQDWLHDSSLSAKGDNAAVTVYHELTKRPKPPKPPGGGQVRFDQHLAPGAQKGQDPAQAAKQRDPTAWKAAVASAAQAAEMQGKLPASLKRLVGEILEPKVSWQDHIRASLNRVSGSEGLDWTQPDRRMLSRGVVGHDPVFFARSSGYSSGTIVVAVDTSGSIGDDQVTAFFREMHGIFSDMNPAMMVIMDCDAKVHSVREIEELDELDDIRKQGLGGGGGTAFAPVFKKVERRQYEPDVLVYLTDMYGSFPDVAPGYPVIWASITESVKTAPFGEVVYVEV